MPLATLDLLSIGRPFQRCSEKLYEVDFVAAKVISQWLGAVKGFTIQMSLRVMRFVCCVRVYMFLWSCVWLCFGVYVCVCVCVCVCGCVCSYVCMIGRTDFCLDFCLGVIVSGIVLKRKLCWKTIKTSLYCLSSNCEFFPMSRKFGLSYMSNSHWFTTQEFVSFRRRLNLSLRNHRLNIAIKFAR